MQWDVAQDVVLEQYNGTLPKMHNCYLKFVSFSFYATSLAEILGSKSEGL